MKQTIVGGLLPFLSIIAAATGCSADNNLTVPVTDQNATSSLVQSNNQFAMDLYQKISSANDDDLFFSPLSISTALGMTYTGARGETATEMAGVLHFSMSVENTNHAFLTLINSLTSPPAQEPDSDGHFTLALSNGLWVQSGYTLLDSFVENLTENYAASVENLDFAGNSESARETINNKIAEETMNRIKDLIPRGMLNSGTRLVLTNAVYFKAAWKNAFDEQATFHGNFFLTDGSAVNTPMMSQTDRFSYFSSGEFSAISLDYAGGDASMLILLPDGNFHAFEQSLDAEMLDSIQSSMSDTEVHITMPKFEFTRETLLKDILSALGMESAFEQTADFSGITGRRDLFISDVIHKAFVKVDESGTEAAAATAVVMELTAIRPEPPEEMNIDRPFIFLIRDNRTGAVVFMGRVMNPST